MRHTGRRQKGFSIVIVVVVCLLPLPFVSCALLGLGGGEDSWTRAENYAVQPPAGWRSRDKESSDRAYRLPSGNVATLTSSCNRNPDAPLDLLTRHLLMGMRQVRVDSQEPLTIDGQPALMSRIRARMEGVPFHLMLVVTSQKGCVFDFTLLSPKEIPPKDTQDFLAFVRSFRNGKN